MCLFRTFGRTDNIIFNEKNNPKLFRNVSKMENLNSTLFKKNSKYRNLEQRSSGW
jgi:hypothetical protein